MNRLVVLLLLGLTGLAIAKIGRVKKADKDGILDEEDNDKFETFKGRFKRNCTDGADACKQRKRNFANNLKRIKKFQKNNTDTKEEFGVTEFADWSTADLKKLVINPDKMPAPLDSIVVPEPKRSKRATATAFDWRTKGVVTPVKNQGQCGCCWAFAASAAVETASNIINKRYNASQRSYSEQQIMTCTQSSPCNGGWPATALNSIKTKGAARTATVPYTGKETACPSVAVDMPVNTVVDMTGNVASALSFVGTTGPITAAFYVCEDFYYYTSGIYSTNCTTSSANFLGGHAVTIMGYGTNSAGVNYWLVKNSWGTNWGMAGYFQIKRGTDTCKFETWGLSAPTAKVIA
ncbi:unnamed protein product, partial [Mesorhabditis spiculigera]